MKVPIEGKVRLGSAIDSFRRLPGLLRYGTALVWERARPAQLSRADDIPYCAETITPVWLSEVLCDGVDGAEVLAIDVAGGDDGSTSRRALKVTYNEAGIAAELPERLFTKAVPKLRQRMSLAASGKLAAETEFYRAVRPMLGIEAPGVFYAAFDVRSGRSLQIFEDIVSSRGAQFLNAFSEIEREDAEEIVRALAAYHGAMWDHPALRTLPSMMTTLQWQRKMNRAIAFEERCYVGIRRAEAVIPAELLHHPRKLWAAHMESIALGARHPRTLLHNDTHLGNWYVLPDGKMGLADWCMYKGQWASDYSYAISSALSIDNRRAWEQDLLRTYLAAIQERGVEDVTFEAAWTAYRQQMLHAFFYWAITIGGGPLQTDMQPDEISLVNLQRMGQAIVDLDTLAALSAS